MTQSIAKDLYDLISKEPPPDLTSNHVILRGNGLSGYASCLSDFNQILDRYVSLTTNKSFDPSEVRRHWQYILLGLAQCIYMRKWLSIRLDSKAYGDRGDFWVKNIGLNRGIVSLVVSCLKDNGLISWLPETIQGGYIIAPRIFPSEQLSAELWSFFDYIEEPIGSQYVLLDRTEGPWSRTISVSHMAEYQSENSQMAVINEFLRSHQWACKSPIMRVIGSHGGHPSHPHGLLTAFQYLEDPVIRHRTLIDNNPVVELKMDANQLRLAVAIFERQYAGDNPFEDIAELSGNINPEAAEVFIDAALNEQSEQDAWAICSIQGLSQDAFGRLRDATLKRYPKIQLFKAWAFAAREHTSKILLEIIQEGAMRDIVCLPIENGIVTSLGNEEWVTENTLELWSHFTNGIKTSVKMV